MEELELVGQFSRVGGGVAHGLGHSPINIGNRILGHELSWASIPCLIHRLPKLIDSLNERNLTLFQ